MTQRIRGLIYLIFLIGFLITAPLVVLYTAGYRYSFDTGLVVETGILSLTSEPRGATVLIDEEEQNERTPVVLDDLVPGEHTVTIQKNGYTSWKKTLEIKSRETTFVRDVVLFLHTEPTRVRDAEFLSLDHSPSQNKTAFIKEEDGWYEVWMFERSNADEMLLMRVPADPATKFELAWSLSGTYLSVFINTTRQTTYSIINTNDLSSSSVSGLVPNAKDGWWDAARDERYFAETPEGITQIDVALTEIVPLEFSADTLMSHGDDYILSETIDNRNVISRWHEGQSFILGYLPISTYIFHPSKEGKILLSDEKHERLTILDASGADQPILLNTDATLWHWDPNSTRLLYSNGFDLHVYDPDAHVDETLTRFSDELTGLSWYPTGSTVLYAQANSISSIELDRRDTRNVTHLIQGEDIDTIWLTENGKELFFTGTLNGTSGLYSQELQR